MPEPSPIAVGKVAPSLKLEDLSRDDWELRDVIGNRAVLLVFGSRSDPAFRDLASKLDELWRDRRNRVEMVWVYTGEAFPEGDSNTERNVQNGVFIAAHHSLRDRQIAAKEGRDSLGLRMKIVLDTMSDDAVKAYGVPRGAVLIDRQGKVVYTQQHLDPFRLREAIDKLPS